MLRLLDANLNRAREALRLLEDYARFELDHAEWSMSLKRIRHGLREATGRLAAEAILHRDTPGDVGTGSKTAAEMERGGLADAVVAAGKRAGEALRAVEECLKTTDPAAAGAVEKLRYRLYDLEHRLALTLRPAGRLENLRLYVIITTALCRRDWLETARLAIEGGADAVQLREKSMEGGELLARARRLACLCRDRGVLCIINDRADIARAANADGVHVGQEDLPAVEVRKIVGHRAVVGVSTHNLEQARKAIADGADYLGVGPVYPSRTKPRDILPGLEYARRAASLPRPTVAIAGIDAGNAAEVAATGVKAVAVSSAVIAADDPRAAAAAIKAAFAGR